MSVNPLNLVRKKWLERTFRYSWAERREKRTQNKHITHFMAESKGNQKEERGNGL